MTPKNMNGRDRSRPGHFTGPAACAAVLLLYAGVCGASDTVSAVPQPKRPNVLLLLTDDQRADAIAALGNPAIKTPAMDSLARRGFIFRNAYCFGSNVPAVCLPSRNMLMSGRAYFRWEGPFAPADKPNFPVALKQAGYVTYHHGKRGNSAELIQAKFDASKYLKNDLEREGGEPGRTFVDEAIDFLKHKQASGDHRPFFMYLAPPDPHDPRIAASKYLDLYQPDRIPLPKNYMPLHPFDNGEMRVRDELLAPWPRTPEEIRRQLRDYYAVITGLDYHVGRLLAALEDLGLADDTIVIFSSDNGLAIGSHGLMGKQSLYEHSAKVPLILAGPGIPKGGSDALVYLMDLLPTVCDLVGAPAPADLDGKSLKGVIEGKSKSVRDSLFYAYRGVQRAIRDDRFKLILYPRINKKQLFDLTGDPDELHDLSADPAQAGRIEQMTAKLGDWQRQIGDTCPLTSSNPQDPTFTPPRD